MSIDQYRAAQAIMDCRSEALGYEEWSCQNDGHVERLPHACKNRSCPMCHGAQSHAWLEQTKQRLLPCSHYHVVFTVPHELNPIWQYNRKWCADRLFKAASETMRQLLADERYLGAEVGILASLHTWGRTLNFHPHVHLLVSGGGLDGAGQWRDARQDYLVPVGVLKAKFRGKWLSWLNAAYAEGELHLPPDWTPDTWKQVLRRVARRNWNVRIQGAYAHGSGVAVYLSRYVRGGPIKDSRLLQGDQHHVSFGYRDHHSGKLQSLTLATEHFLTRVFWHVPVKGQHLVRYYGLYTPGAVAKRAQIRDLLGAPPEAEAEPTPVQEHKCPQCGRALLPRCSMRRKISSIGSGTVQQGVQAAPVSPDWPRSPSICDPPYVFLAPAGAA